MVQDVDCRICKFTSTAELTAERKGEQCGPNSFRLKLPQEKIDSGLHPVFHTKNLKSHAPDPSYEGKFYELPDSQIADQEYEITKIMAHRN